VHALIIVKRTHFLDELLLRDLGRELLQDEVNANLLGGLTCTIIRR
jgi:hypothetical protein